MKEGKQGSDIRKIEMEVGNAYIHNLFYCVQKFFNQKYPKKQKTKM